MHSTSCNSPLKWRPAFPAQAGQMQVEWSDSLHECFLAAVHRLGADKAVPSKILEAMGPAAAGMTLQDIAGHLQCYRQASSQLAAPTSAPAPSPAPAPQPPVAYVHAAAAPWMFTSMPAGDPAFPGAAPTPLGMPQLPPGPAALPVGVFGVPAGGISGISGVPASPAGENGMSLVANLIPGQFPFFAGLPPQVLSASGFASAPGLPLAGNVPGMPYAMPMQMPTGQCWGPPTYNMQPGQASSVVARHALATAPACQELMHLHGQRLHAAAGRLAWIRYRQLL